MSISFQKGSSHRGTLEHHWIDSSLDFKLEGVFIKNSKKTQGEERHRKKAFKHKSYEIQC
jgi:hypothetical protein